MITIRLWPTVIAGTAGSAVATAALAIAALAPVAATCRRMALPNLRQFLHKSPRPKIANPHRRSLLGRTSACHSPPAVRVEHLSSIAAATLRVAGD
jgi:hypothetical protein